MDFFDESKLLLFVVFMMPGFICMKVYSLLYPMQIRDFNQNILDSITYSCVIYGFNSVFILLVEYLKQSYSFPILYSIFYFYIIFISPVALAYIWVRFRESEWLRELNIAHPDNSPWDFVFKTRTACWVIITLNDSTKIYGKYGSGSFVSSYPHEPQIYLNECWHPNEKGGFKEKHKASAGIIILSKDIRSVELFEDEDHL